MIISSVTLVEILEVLDDISCEYEVGEGETEGSVWIDCDLSGAEFTIFPWGIGPFYQDFSLDLQFVLPSLTPRRCVHNSIKKHSFATAVPFDLNELSDDDTSAIIVQFVKKSQLKQVSVKNFWVRLLNFGPACY